MECEDVHARLADHLSGTLPATEAEAVARHLADCRACAAEAEAFADTWEMLGTIPSESPRVAMRARFEAMLDGYHAGIGPRPVWSLRPRQAVYLAATAALFLIGLLVGRQTAPAPLDPQLAALRDEIRGLRELTAIALLHQPSPSDRLKGVAWTGQIDEPGVEVASVLLDTLVRDPNANVRLAAIDALRRFGDREAVRLGAIEALKHQSSPMVQIALIDFVAEVNGPDAADALRHLSNDPLVNATVRARAAAVLQRMG